MGKNEQADRMYMRDMTECPLCTARLESAVETILATSPDMAVAYIKCPACGEYGIQVMGGDGKLWRLTETQRATLAAYVCARSLDHKKAVILWAELSGQVNIPNEIWIPFDRIMKEFPLPPITERFDLALLNLSRTHKPGQVPTLGEHYLGLLCSEDKTTQLFILETLIERGDINGVAMLPSEFKITARGWIRVEEINKGLLGKENRQAFVAMWFDSSMEDLFSKGIAPAIKDAGFEPFRVDKNPSNNQYRAPQKSDHVLR